MCTQHSTEKEATHEQGIVVPLELDGLRILKQEVQPDGKIRVEVIGTNERASCPHCEQNRGRSSSTDGAPALRAQRCSTEIARLCRMTTVYSRRCLQACLSRQKKAWPQSPPFLPKKTATILLKILKSSVAASSGR